MIKYLKNNHFMQPVAGLTFCQLCEEKVLNTQWGRHKVECCSKYVAKYSNLCG